MHSRCRDVSDINYGGRGITICDEWSCIEKFVADMGQPDTNGTLERRDTNLGYFKDNCLWATQAEQVLNVRQRKDNSTGRTGVYLIEKSGNYRVIIQSKGSTYSGGTFELFEDAVAAREKLELKHHGKVRPDAYECKGEYH